MKKTFILFVCTLLFLSFTGCATTYSDTDVELMISQTNYQKMFEAYGADDDHCTSKGKLGKFFQQNQKETEKHLITSLSDEKATVELIRGTAEVTRRLKSTAVLPAIEKRLLNENIGDNQFQLAWAIDDINSPASQDGVLAALKKDNLEVRALVALAKYLTQNPVSLKDVKRYEAFLERVKYVQNSEDKYVKDKTDAILYQIAVQKLKNAVLLSLSPEDKSKAKAKKK